MQSCSCRNRSVSIFFFNATATTEIYTLSLHDALPICAAKKVSTLLTKQGRPQGVLRVAVVGGGRSEEHTSELQSQSNLVCRLLLEKKNTADALRGAKIELDPLRVGGQAGPACAGVIVH